MTVPGPNLQSDEPEGSGGGNPPPEHDSVGINLRPGHIHSPGIGTTHDLGEVNRHDLRVARIDIEFEFQLRFRSARWFRRIPVYGKRPRKLAAELPRPSHKGGVFALVGLC